MGFPPNFLSLVCRIASYASDCAAAQQIRVLKAHRHVCSFQDLFSPTSLGRPKTTGSFSV